MIKIRNLTKKFGSLKALENVDITIRKGPTYGLFGSYGAGKTTLVKHLAGVYRQDEGTVTFDGRPVFENQAVKPGLVYISDDLCFSHSF